jgi:hypothetical protein
LDSEVSIDPVGLKWPCAGVHATVGVAAGICDVVAVASANPWSWLVVGFAGELAQPATARASRRRATLELWTATGLLPLELPLNELLSPGLPDNRKMTDRRLKP